MAIFVLTTTTTTTTRLITLPLAHKRGVIIDSKSIIIEEGEHYGPVLQPLWVHDLCSDIHIQSSFTGCPITSHTISSCISALQYIPYPQIVASSVNIITNVMTPNSVVTQAHSTLPLYTC